MKFKGFARNVTNKKYAEDKSKIPDFISCTIEDRKAWKAEIDLKNALMKQDMVIMFKDEGVPQRIAEKATIKICSQGYTQSEIVIRSLDFLEMFNIIKEDIV